MSDNVSTRSVILKLSLELTLTLTRALLFTLLLLFCFRARVRVRLSFFTKCLQCVVLTSFLHMVCFLLVVWKVELSALLRGFRVRALASVCTSLHCATGLFAMVMDRDRKSSMSQVVCAVCCVYALEMLVRFYLET